MENKETGWVIINIGHPATGESGIYSGSFRWNKRQAIKDFIGNTGNSWEYWRNKFNFRCVRAEITIKTSTNE